MVASGDGAPVVVGDIAAVVEYVFVVDVVAA